jgi:integrase
VGHKRIALKWQPGSEEFARAYQEALAADKPSATTPAEGPRSVGAMIAEYYLSADWRDLKPSTQKSYRLILESFRNEHGTKQVSTIEPLHLNAIFHAMAATPALASNLRKRLRSAFELAKDLGWRKDNPINETKKLKHKTTGHTPWSEEDIAAFEAKWPSGTRERLALALLIYTGVRRSDVVQLGAQHVKDGRIRLVQVKTGEENVPIKIPVHPLLKVELDKTPLGMTYLLTMYGNPFSKEGFSAWFVERAKEAGLSGRTPHGLRKAAGRRLAEAGCSGKEIAAVLGHSSLAMVETYTRSADQGRLADQAMTKLKKDGSGTKL